MGLGAVYFLGLLAILAFVAGLPAPPLVLRWPRATLAVYGAVALSLFAWMVAVGWDRGTVVGVTIFCGFAFGCGCALSGAFVAARIRREGDARYAQIRSNAAGSSGSSQQPATRSPASR